MGAPLNNGFGGNGVPPKDDIEQITRRPGDNRQINAAIQQSVQEFPPAINTGAFFAQTVRGPLLPPYGTKDRDYWLRFFYRNEYNTLIQGTVSAITKKFVTTPWEIKGDPQDEQKLLRLTDDSGRTYTITLLEHYQRVLQNAQFGMGWEAFASRFLEDFFVQDFGGVWELSGLGEPTGPIEGVVTGLAQLDAGRCWITGNPYYPMMYFSLISGSLHRMHASRVVRFVDSPSPDERFFGIGLCAMSRAIAVYTRQQYMQKYIESRVDDKPAPGIMAVTGMTEQQLKTWRTNYEKEQTLPDDHPFWGKTMFATSIDIDHPLKFDHTPFAVTPEKFDWEKYNSLDVDAICLAFGIDRQEIWELAGRGLGSSSQSKTLAEKATAKMFGFLLQNTERMINRRVIPSALEFSFSYRDVQEQTSIATQNQASATTIQILTTPGQAVMTTDEARQYLADNSPEFKDVLTNDAGQVQSMGTPPDQDVSLEDDNPIQPGEVEQSSQPQAPSPQQTQPAQQPQVSSDPGLQTQTQSLRKEFATDEQRKWFFANNPDFAEQRSMPHLEEGATAEQHRQQLEHFVENHNNRVVHHLWDTGSINYNDKGQIVVQPANVKSAAAELVKESRDASLSRKELVRSFSEAEGHQGDQRQLENKMNAAYANKARAIQLAAHVGGVKLTDAQNRHLNDISQGKYLDNKYSQYASGNRGTIWGTQGTTSRGTSEFAQHMHEENLRHFRVNVRGGGKSLKAFGLTASDFSARFTSAAIMAVNRRIEQSEFEDVLLDLLSNAGTQSLVDGLRSGGVNEPPDDTEMNALQDWLQDQIEFIDQLAAEIYAQPGLDEDAVRTRADMWVNKSLRQIFQTGQLSADSNGLYEWQLGMTEDHCDDCLRLNTQIHRLKEWYSRGWLPQGDRLSCHGYRCDCRLVKTDEPAWGRF